MDSKNSGLLCFRQNWNSKNSGLLRFLKTRISKNNGLFASTKREFSTKYNFEKEKLNLTFKLRGRIKFFPRNFFCVLDSRGPLLGGVFCVPWSLRNPMMTNIFQKKFFARWHLRRKIFVSIFFEWIFYTTSSDT